MRSYIFVIRNHSICSQTIKIVAKIINECTIHSLSDHFFKLPNIYAKLESFLVVQQVIASGMSSLDYEPPIETLSTYCQKNKFGI
jgi:hypothetical protein